MPSHICFPKLYFKALQKQYHAEINYFMDMIYNSDTDREKSRTHTNCSNLDRIWYRWILFLQRIELKDEPLLENIEELNRPSLIIAPAVAVRE